MSQSLTELPSTDSQKFPLWAALQLYNTGRSFLYLNYMADFKLLTDWLGPLDIPEKLTTPIPWWQGNYEVQRLAILFGTDEETIYFTLQDDVL
jgi:hypothetical protein